MHIFIAFVQYYIITIKTADNLSKSESQKENVGLLASDWLVYDEILPDSNGKVSTIIAHFNYSPLL